MRRFLIAFVSLSALAMAQNVVVALPLAADSVIAINANWKSHGSRFVPEPATVMLMVAGLSGLAAVGGRNHDRKKRVSR